MKYDILALAFFLLVSAAPLTHAQQAQALRPEQIPPVTVQVRGSDAADAFAALQDSGIFVVPLGSLAERSFIVPVEMRFHSVQARALVEAVARLHGVQVTWWKGALTAAVLQRGASKEEVARIVADLGSASAATRAEAAWRAGWTEEASLVPLLASATGDADPSVSFQASRSLKRLGWPAAILFSPQKALDLVSHVDDVRYAFSRPAWRMIAATWQAKALDLFKKAVDQGASDALPALATIPGDDASALLSSALDTSKDLYFRRQAVAALGVKGGEPAYAALSDALRDPQTFDVALATLAHTWKERALPAVQDALQGRNKAAGLAALGEMGGDKALGLCAPALADQSVPVRQAAARALGAIGGPGALAPLKKALADPAVEVWREAVLGLAEIGGSEAVNLVLAAADAPREASGIVAQALGVVGGDRARERLSALLAGAGAGPSGAGPSGAGSPGAAPAAAAEALARIGDDASLAALAKAFPSAAPGTRAAIIRAVGNAGGARALPVVTQAVSDADPDVTRAVIEAASNLGSVDALSGVLSAPRTRTDAAVRRLVAASLGAVGGPSAIGVLGTMLGDPDATVRGSVVYALAAAQLPQSVTPLERAVADPDPGVQARAREGLGGVGGAEVLAFAEKLLDSDPVAAVDLLSYLDPSQTTRVWAKALASSNPAVTNAALTTVKDLGQEKGAAILRALLASDIPATRITAANLLRQVIGYAALKDLAALLKDPDAGVRQQAFRLLAEIVTNEGVDLYASLLVDKNEETRRTAVQALSGVDSAQLERVLRKAAALDNATLVDAVRKYGTQSWLLVIGRINNATPQTLAEAVKANDLARVKDLIGKGANAGSAASDGRTAYQSAAAAGALDILGYLISIAPGDTRAKVLADALKSAGTAGSRLSSNTSWPRAPYPRETSTRRTAWYALPPPGGWISSWCS